MLRYDKQSGLTEGWARFVLSSRNVYPVYATRRVIHIHKGAVSTNMKMLKANVEVPVRTYCW